jgi:hypothetical protein
MMFEKQERTALMLLLVVLVSCGIFAWISEGIGKSPFAQNYTSEAAEGSLVSYLGVVQKVAPTISGGNTILEMSGVQIFLPSSVSGDLKFSAGDTIQVYGVVQQWKEKREILVKDPKDITILVVSQGKNQRS